MQHLVVLEVVQQRMRHAAFGVLVRKTAVPGTRIGGFAAMLSMKRSSGIVSCVKRSSRIARPRFQVVSSVNTTTPIDDREPAAVAGS